MPFHLVLVSSNPETRALPVRVQWWPPPVKPCSSDDLHNITLKAEAYPGDVPTWNWTNQVSEKHVRLASS